MSSDEVLFWHSCLIPANVMHICVGWEKEFGGRVGRVQEHPRLHRNLGIDPISAFFFLCGRDFHIRRILLGVCSHPAFGIYVWLSLMLLLHCAAMVALCCRGPMTQLTLWLCILGTLQHSLSDTLRHPLSLANRRHSHPWEYLAVSYAVSCGLG